MTTTPQRPATSSPDITSLGAPGQGAGALPGGVRAGRPASQHPRKTRPGPVDGCAAGRRPGRGGGVPAADRQRVPGCAAPPGATPRPSGGRGSLAAGQPRRPARRWGDPADRRAGCRRSPGSGPGRAGERGGRGRPARADPADPDSGQPRHRGRAHQGVHPGRRGVECAAGGARPGPAPGAPTRPACRLSS